MKEYDELAVLEEIQQELMSEGKASRMDSVASVNLLILSLWHFFVLQNCPLLKSTRGTSCSSSSTYHLSWKEWMRCILFAPYVTREFKNQLLETRHSISTIGCFNIFKFQLKLQTVRYSRLALKSLSQFLLESNTELLCR